MEVAIVVYEAPGSPFDQVDPMKKINQGNIRLGWRRDYGRNRNSNTHALYDHQFLTEAQIHVKINKPCSEFVLISKQANCFQLPACGMLKILSDKKKKDSISKLLSENYYM